MELYVILAVLGLLMLASLLSSKLSSLINMPCLLLFLAVGLLWGSDTVTSFITTTPLIPDAQSAQMTKGVSPVFANYLGSIAMAFILFSGGFDTDWKSIKSVFRTGELLSTMGVLLSAVFTGLGLYEKLAKHGGAGTLVPITGFANAVASPAIDTKAEGFILGVGAKIFTVAGPVILYGTTASAIYGVILYILRCLG